jgi:molybdopterin-guanine dinucleotide biosynthesis protein MobB
MSEPHIFAVSGFSGTGKTSLIETLVKHLLEKGLLVGVVKSSKEDVLAPPDTDTRRYQGAGGSPVILLGPKTTTIRYRQRMKLRKAIGENVVDFLLLEGFKSFDVPKFWCIGNKEEIPLVPPKNTKAIVRWKKGTIGEGINQLPVITSDEIELLLEIIEKEAVLLSECGL